jgi:hypothetical protein
MISFQPTEIDAKGVFRKKKLFVFLVIFISFPLFLGFFFGFLD